MIISQTLHNIDVISKQLRTANTVRRILTMLVYMGYLVFRLATGAGYLGLNIALLAVTMIDFCFFISYASANRKKAKAQHLKMLDKICRYTRLGLGFVGAALSIMGILTVAQEITPFNLLIGILLPVFLVLQLVFDVLYEYVRYCLRLVKEGVKADINKAKKVVTAPLKTAEGMRETVEGVRNITKGVKSIAQAMLGRKKKENVIITPEPAEPEIAAADAQEKIEEPTPEVIELPDSEEDQGYVD